MMSRLRRTALVSTSLALAAASVLTVSATSTANAAAPAAPTVNVFVAKNHAVAMTQRLRPGNHKFVIRSAAEAGFQLIQAAPGYTKREAARDVFRGLTRGRIPALKRFEANVTLLGGMPSAPGKPAVMWAKLPAGTVWALDTMPSRPEVGKILSLRVGGDRIDDRVKQGSVVRAINDADFARRPTSIAHRGRLTFRNDSTANHFLIMVRLAPGKTVKDFGAWIDSGAEGPPPVAFDAPSLDTGVISPGKKMTLNLNLPRGRYVMTCFWPDADMDAMPHAFMGMYRGIRLT